MNKDVEDDDDHFFDKSVGLDVRIELDGLIDEFGIDCLVVAGEHEQDDNLNEEVDHAQSWISSLLMAKEKHLRKSFMPFLIFNKIITMDCDFIGAIKIIDGLFLGDQFAAADLEYVVAN